MHPPAEASNCAQVPSRGSLTNLDGIAQQVKPWIARSEQSDRAARRA